MSPVQINRTTNARLAYAPHETESYIPFNPAS
jgi:hypothetical protein